MSTAGRERWLREHLQRLCCLEKEGPWAKQSKTLGFSKAG